MLLKIFLSLIAFLSVYFITFFCVIKFKKKTTLKFNNFPNLKLTKSGISFTSYNIHRIKTEAIKIIQIKSNLYLKFETKFVIISNVKDVKIYEQYLYFTALGEVKIIFDCKNFYRYFNLSIKSEQFDFKAFKQQAILDLMNNNFDINFSKITKKYIKIIEKVLNIHIFQEKIIIKPNKFNLSYILTYKLNNRLKRVIINETL